MSSCGKLRSNTVVVGADIAGLSVVYEQFRVFHGSVHVTRTCERVIVSTSEIPAKDQASKRTTRMPCRMETALYGLWILVCILTGFRGYAPWPVVVFVCTVLGSALIWLMRQQVVERNLATASYPGYVTLFAIVYLLSGALYLFGVTLARITAIWSV